MHARTTHASLIARLVDHEDGDAWREFLDRYGALLRGFARRRGVPAEAWDDVVQDVAAAVVQAMESFRYDPARGRFRGFLKTVAMRAISRRLARAGREPASGAVGIEFVDAADEEASDAIWESQWREHHLRRAMRTIETEFGALDRAAFQRYAVAGEPAATVAETLDISIDRVYQAKSRILRRLGALVASQIAEEG